MPLSDGHSPIVDYQVAEDKGAEDGKFTIVGPSTGNSLTFTTNTPLIAGNSYTLLIRAVNLVGVSEYSDPVTIIAGTIPNKTPTPVKFKANTLSIEIRWAEASNGGSAITNYKVFWDSGQGNGEFVLKGSTGGYLTFSVPVFGDGVTLIPGRSYSFKVSAVNDVGEGEQSDALPVIAATVPDKPPNPTLVS